MKKLTATAVMVFVAAAFAADVINGIYNTSGGYQSGYAASGEYLCAYGATSAALSSGGSKSVFFGTASGAFSWYDVGCAAFGHFSMNSTSNCTECVAIGPGAMAGAGSCYRCTAIGPDVGANWRNRSNLVSINGQAVMFPGYMALHPQPLVNEQDEGIDSVSHTSDWRYYDDNGNRPAIEFRTVNDGNSDRTILSFNADEVVISNSSLRIEHVAHADSAQSAEYAGNSGHSVSAEYAYGLQDGGTLNVVSGADILSRIAALEAALIAATNRIAILEAASN